MLVQNNELYVVPHLFVKHTRTKNHCLLAITHTSSDAGNDSTQRHAKRASSSLHGQAVTRREHQTIQVTEHRNFVP